MIKKRLMQTRKNLQHFLMQSQICSELQVPFPESRTIDRVPELNKNEKALKVTTALLV